MLSIELEPDVVLTRFPKFAIGEADVGAARQDCPVCDGEVGEFARLAVGGGAAVVGRGICCACRHITFTRMPDAEWFARFYRQTFETAAAAPSSPPAVDYGMVADLLEPFIELENTILDLGCGYGSAMRFFAERGYRNLVGLELSERRADVAATLGFPIVRRTAETMLEDPALADRPPFDAAFSHHVFEHVVDPVAALASVVAAVRPGGHVLVGIPNQEAEHVLQMAHYIPHIHSFSDRSLATLFDRCGLDLVHLDSGLTAVGRRREDAHGGWTAPPADPLVSVRLQRKFIRDFEAPVGGLAGAEVWARFSDYRAEGAILHPSHGSLTPIGQLPGRRRIAHRILALRPAKRVAKPLAGRAFGGAGPAILARASLSEATAPATDQALPQLTVAYRNSTVPAWLK